MTSCAISAIAHIRTSISRGPFSGDAFSQRLDEIVDVVDRATVNAHAFGDSDKVDGRPVHFSMSMARWPGSPAPTPSNSPRRIW